MLGKTQPFDTQLDIDTNVPSSGTHEPSDARVTLANSVQLGTRGISCVIKKCSMYLQLKIFNCKWCMNYNLSCFNSRACG